MQWRSPWDPNLEARQRQKSPSLEEQLKSFSIGPEIKDLRSIGIK